MSIPSILVTYKNNEHENEDLVININLEETSHCHH